MPDITVTYQEQGPSLFHEPVVFIAYPVVNEYQYINGCTNLTEQQHHKGGKSWGLQEEQPFQHPAVRHQRSQLSKGGLLTTIATQALLFTGLEDSHLRNDR